MAILKGEVAADRNCDGDLERGQRGGVVEQILALYKR
jgi:hypothetical protein